LGIGGWIGVGKSTICSFFKEELSADVLSLDSISHELYEVPEVSSALRNAFGTSVRSEIAMKLTEDPSLWEDLDNIFKPYLIKETLRRHQTSASSLRIIEGSLVLRLGLQAICDLVAWVTFHPLEEAIKRSSIRMGKPFSYSLSILQRQIETNIFDPSKVDVLLVGSSEKNSRKLYEELRTHLHL